MRELVSFLSRSLCPPVIACATFNMAVHKEVPVGVRFCYCIVIRHDSAEQVQTVVDEYVAIFRRIPAGQRHAARALFTRGDSLRTLKRPAGRKHQQHPHLCPKSPAQHSRPVQHLNVTHVTDGDQDVSLTCRWKVVFARALRAMSPLQVGKSVIIEREHLEQLFQTLVKRGYDVIGPTLRDGAIVYDHLTSTEDLPSGWTDEQAGGWYRLKRRKDNALFGYVVGPHSWKKVLCPPLQRLWQAARNGKGLRILPEEEKAKPKYAFIGVRACELHAIAIQDKVFLDGQFVDPGYKARRESLFLVAVNCGQAGGNCFCASMSTGPKATSGYDLALTELLQDWRHRFLV